MIVGNVWFKKKNMFESIKDSNVTIQNKFKSDSYSQCCKLLSHSCDQLSNLESNGRLRDGAL